VIDLGEHLEHFVELAGRDAYPRVADADDHVGILAFHITADPSAVVRVLRGVVQDIGEYLRQAHRVGLDVDGCRRHRKIHVLAALFGQRAAGLDAAAEQAAQFDRLPSDLDAIARDPAHVDEIVHQPREMAQLTVHDDARPPEQRLIAIRPLHQFERVAQRRERPAQFMRQDGQELVFAPVCVAQRFGHQFLFLQHGPRTFAIGGFMACQRQQRPPQHGDAQHGDAENQQCLAGPGIVVTERFAADAQQAEQRRQQHECGNDASCQRARTGIRQEQAQRFTVGDGHDEADRQCDQHQRRLPGDRGEPGQ
jgi:hypothetical protein